MLSNLLHEFRRKMTPEFRVRIPPDATRVARTPRPLSLLSSATAYKIFAVLERPYAVKGLIRSVLEIRIFDVHVTDLMTRRRKCRRFERPDFSTV